MSLFEVAYLGRLLFATFISSSCKSDKTQRQFWIFAEVHFPWSAVVSLLRACLKSHCFHTSRQTEAVDVCDHLRALPNMHDWSRPDVLKSSKPPTRPLLNNSKKNRKQLVTFSQHLQPLSCSLIVSFPCIPALAGMSSYPDEEHSLPHHKDRSFQIQIERVRVLWLSVFLYLLFSSDQTHTSAPLLFFNPTQSPQILVNKFPVLPGGGGG